MRRLTTDISFTEQQIEDFGKLTGDNGPIHSVHKVVQGGLIISSLPKYLNKVIVDNNLDAGFTHSVSMILESKFRQKLKANQKATVEFDFGDPNSKIFKLNWKVFNDDTIFCNGYWVIYRARD